MHSDLPESWLITKTNLSNGLSMKVWASLLAEISPIDDYTGGKLSLRFKDYRFGDPKSVRSDCS